MTLAEIETSGVRLVVDRTPEAAVWFSDRVGGVSAAPFDTLNLAIQVGDDRADVTENRTRVARAAGFGLDTLVLARQVHGAEAIEARAGDSGVIGEADVLVTSAPGLTIGILTADCAPVIVASPDRVAIAHAGWRGVVAGAVERAIESLGTVDRAWVGPSIHSCCYEVGPEVVDAFRSRGLDIPQPGRVDPGRAAGQILRRTGIDDVQVSDVCTSCDRRYFSYRRDGVTGRQGAFVSLIA